MQVSQLYANIGDKVSITASKLTPGSTYELVWETIKGSWQIENEHFIGATYETGVTVVSHVIADVNGNVRTTMTIPDGFGDMHLVGLRDQSGTVVAQTGVTVLPTCTIESTKEKEGSFFKLQLKGMGYGPYTSQFVVLYDNRVTGNLSAVTTNGTANFTVRAEGEGPHVITVESGNVLGPYLNEQQSPFSWKPGFNFNVTVEKGIPKTIQDAIPKPSNAIGNHLTASPGSGVVGSTFQLAGNSMIPNHTYDLEWVTEDGNRVASGYEQVDVPLGTVQTDASGNFVKTVVVPNDLGGPAHAINVVDGQTVAASTTFRVYPKLVSVTPEIATEGQEITVHLQGVGWTEYDNVYSVDYDNGYAGYACGFNSHGDVEIKLRATGSPGFHYIDLYPTIYKGKQTLPNVYGFPQLTYAQDHPGDDLPAFHIVIDIKN